MKLISQSITLNGPAEAIWKKLLYWQEWPTWDKGMESVTFDGPLKNGSAGTLKLKKGPSVQLVVTELTELKSYTDEFSLFGTRFIFIHFLTPLPGNQFRVTVEVEADGLSAPIMAGIMKSGLEKELPGWMTTFKNQYEQQMTTTVQ